MRHAVAILPMQQQLKIGHKSQRIAMGSDVGRLQKTELLQLRLDRAGKIGAFMRRQPTMIHHRAPAAAQWSEEPPGQQRSSHPQDLLACRDVMQTRAFAQYPRKLDQTARSKQAHEMECEARMVSSQLLVSTLTIEHNLETSPLGLLE